MCSRAGTFEYAGEVPVGYPDASRPWHLSDASGADFATGSDRIRNRLVGLKPTLEITSVGMTPDVRVSPYTGFPRPRVLLSRLTLRASEQARAAVAAFSFCIDQALAQSWRPGDVLHMTRTPSGGLGLSVVRDGQLVTAVGAVTAVSHGRFVTVRIPRDVLREAEGVVRRLDPEFEFAELPIEIRVATETRVLYAGRPRIGGYRVFVEHGFYRGIPGTPECAALSLVGSCPETAAICSAQLMEYADLSTTIRW